MQVKDKILSCDWGTSAFRLRLADTTDFSTIAEEKNGQGIADTFSRWKASGQDAAGRWSFYLQVIQQAVSRLEEKLHASLNNLPLVVSGMASSTVGMIDLPYREVPFLTSGAGLHIHHVAATASFHHPAVIISGVRTDGDVMRGEETKLVGCASAGGPEALFIFPGTHSKHVVVKEGRVTGFSTYMTGEFFALLLRHSVLASSVQAGGTWEEENNRKRFREGVAQSCRSNILNSSFMVRTNDVLQQFSKPENYYYLSGVLIGTEIGQVENSRLPVVLAGSASFNAYYAAAMQVLHPSVQLRIIDADEALVRGQYRLLRLPELSEP